ADALGMHLDSFQRIVVEPGSISVVRYTDMRPFVLRCNDNSSALGSIVPAKPKRRRSRKRSADATVGGAV
ncbi:MAG: phosphoglycerate mutase, partial [Sciscionella sp.]|nr:phosphoglycerate mutase [Sciscionella sp.]